ncbi:MAG: aspartate-semialdehyde dehydrogenase [Candidatus Omnitrophota bacterium]
MRKKAKYHIAVVGVGAVGIEMLRVLKSRNFPVGTLKVLARSERDIVVDGSSYHVEAISPESFEGVDIALFAGTEGEKGAAVTYAPEAVKRGAIVIDNGADFRMEPDVPLVVPEVNPRDIKLAKKGRGIIANPNCSTIQMVVALAPIHKLYKIKRVIVSTYQAASGAGSKAVTELFEQTRAVLAGHEDVRPEALPQRIAFNIFPQIGGFADCDYTSEEWKMIKETHKILHSEKIMVSATTVRVPVRTSHSESVYLETKRPVDIEEAKKILSQSEGIKVMDDVKGCGFPLPVEIEGKDEVFVGRLRKDPYNDKGMWMWIVADNLRKGAATNAVQIAELLIKR